MLDKHIKLVNNITNCYKESISILPKEKNDRIISIKLNNFGLIKLTLKNDNREKIYYDSENYELVNDGPIQIYKQDKGYLVACRGEYNEESVIFTYDCEEIEYSLELYDYASIKVYDKEIICDYRIKLGAKIAYNLLMKHAVLGDEGLNEREIDAIPMAMWIALMDFSRDVENTGAPIICKASDIFLQYNNRYEKEEFLREACKITNLYEGNEEVRIVCDIMKEGLEKLIKSKEKSTYSDIKESLSEHINQWDYKSQAYQIYVYFTNFLINACKDFDMEEKTEETQLEKYIKEEVVPLLKKKGFNGNYPTLRMKTEDKLYIINFEKDKDLIINFSDELLENKDIKILLKTMHYEDIKIEDTIAWDVYNCNSEDVIDDEIETILDTIVVDKSMGGDLLKKCIVQSIGFAMTVDMIVYAIWQPNAKTCAILGLVCFALYLALSYVACAFVAIGEDYIEEEEAKHGNE